MQPSARQRELQIRIAAALADAGTAAGNCNGSGNDQVDMRQIAGIYGAAHFRGASDRRGGAQVAQTPGIQLPEAARLPQAREGHVHDLPFAQGPQPHVTLRSIRVALDQAGAAPLVERGESIGGGRRADEVGDPTARAGKCCGAPLFHERPDAIADGLLAVGQGSASQVRPRRADSPNTSAAAPRWPRRRCTAAPSRAPCGSSRSTCGFGW